MTSSNTTDTATARREDPPTTAKKKRSRELIIAQLIGQVALLLAIPVLTRLLSPAEMGIYQTGLSVALILQPLATLRRELLIPFAGVRDARKHRWIGLGFAATLSGAIALVALPAWALGNATLAETLLATALILPSFALMYVENAFLIRHSAQGRLAVRNLVGGVLSAGLQVVAALILPGAIAIAAALLLGRAAATFVTVARRTPSSDVESPGEKKSQRSISAILSAMIAAASSQAVVIVSFASLGPSAAAQVAVGQRVAGAPASLIGQALTQIALSSAAPLIREQRPGMTSQLRSLTIRTGAAAAVTAAALMIGGPLLAVPILGPGWEVAGVMTAVFAVPLSLTLVALPATTLLIPLGRERLLVSLQTVRLVAIVAAIVVSSALTQDVFTTSIVTAAVWTLAYVPLMTAAFTATVAHDRLCAQVVNQSSAP
ncbi:oligosaccharide flippase family protein [Microbacterium sp. LWH7-1.2]|uniref:lipopolysaccharide biosynthesis protein n=1 Tax=Microbacterium sp. LWH7-1.2 TaxID=3135257 RepID=UPI003139B401